MPRIYHRPRPAKPGRSNIAPDARDPTLTRADAEALDAADELASLREEFVLPEGVVYLDGNSLGALPRRAVERLRDVVEREWGRDLIRSWNANGWIDLPARVAGLIAPLIGASADEVAVADSTSVNVFKLLAGGLRLRPGRRVILSEEANFPTDLYVAQGLSRLLGDVELRLVPRDGLRAALGGRRRRAPAHPRGLPHRRDPRHGGPDAGRPRRRRARALGPRAQRGRGARGPRRLRGRPRRGLRLQVPERRPGRARLRVRRAAVALGLRDPALRLDGPRRPLRLRPALPAGARRGAAPLRHAAHPQPRRARVRGRDGRPRRDRAPAPQVGGADRPLRPRSSSRSAAASASPSPRRARPSGAAARCRCATRRRTRSSRPSSPAA